MKTIDSLLLFIIITTFNPFVNCVKLNERRILLPFNNGVNTNFTLEATNDNCYQWFRQSLICCPHSSANYRFFSLFTIRSSSRVDVAIVEPLDEGKSCSRKAQVSVVSTNPKRQSTVVTATNTGLKVFGLSFY